MEFWSLDVREHHVITSGWLHDPLEQEGKGADKL